MRRAAVHVGSKGAETEWREGGREGGREGRKERDVKRRRSRGN